MAPTACGTAAKVMPGGKGNDKWTAGLSKAQQYPQDRVPVAILGSPPCQARLLGSEGNPGFCDSVPNCFPRPTSHDSCLRLCCTVAASFQKNSKADSEFSPLANDPRNTVAASSRRSRAPAVHARLVRHPSHTFDSKSRRGPGHVAPLVFPRSHHPHASPPQRSAADSATRGLPAEARIARRSAGAGDHRGAGTGLTGTIALSIVGDSSAGHSALRVDSDLTIDGFNGNDGIAIAQSAPTLADVPPGMRLFLVDSGGSLTLDGDGGYGNGCGGGAAAWADPQATTASMTWNRAAAVGWPRRVYRVARTPTAAIWLAATAGDRTAVTIQWQVSRDGGSSLRRRSHGPCAATGRAPAGLICSSGVSQSVYGSPGAGQHRSPLGPNYIRRMGVS